MSVKIRLSRHGRKRLPFYHIVVTDSRAPRDGKYIERIGSYSPTTKPATINLDFDKALNWLLKGAQPTDTCRAILSQEGVLIKKHLLEGVKKGAFDEAEADRRFDAWKTDKELQQKMAVENISASRETEKKARFDAETKVNEVRAAAISERLAKIETERKAVEDAAKAEAAEKAEAKANAEAEAKAKVEAKAEAKANVEAEAKAEAKVEAKANVEANVEAKAKANAEAKAKVKAKAETKVEVKAEVKAETKATKTTKEVPVEDVKKEEASEETKNETEA
jgi:small subunit ribosomal protein S16